MGSINTTPGAWDEAMERLMEYFHAMDFGGLEHRTRKAVELVSHAKATLPEGALPLEWTMQTASRALTDWFALALAEAVPAATHKFSAGLLAWHVTGGSARWGDVLLNGEPPADLRKAFAGVRAQTGPDLSVSRMIPRDMDFGPLEGIAQETIQRFAWAPILQALLLWTAIFFAALLVHDHFFLK